MKKLGTFLIIGIIIVACSSDNGKVCCVNIDTGISIKYLNQNGENLLEINNGFNISDINIYHKIDNEWVKYFEGNLDYPKGLKTVERENGTYLVVFPSIEIFENNYSETKIEFSQNDSDIIKSEIEISNSNTIVTKVWYNDQLKWEAYQTERMFEIIK